MIEISKRRYDAVTEMIDVWEREGVVDAETASRLRGSVSPIPFDFPFDWLRATRWLLILALCCFAVGIAALLQTEWIVALIRRIFGSAPAVKSVFFAALAAVFYAAAYRRRLRRPERVFTNEALLMLGVLSTASSIAWLGVALGSGSRHFSLLLALAAAVYAVIAVAMNSALVWIFSLFSLGSWLGAETGYISGWGAYWLGMNYPARFVLYGGALAAASHFMERVPRFSGFQRPTLSVGLLFLFVSLWMMSIFGNNGLVDGSWRQTGRTELFLWCAAFAAAAGVSLWLGIKRDDMMLRGYGAVFLAINVYTRFFENFWNAMNKGLFFLILGASLWFLGSKAERIWNAARRDGGTGAEEDDGDD
ncbi:MAG TPA: DUF2157 domain-containing protein [Candidatus Caccocola faecipullorum]|nr:DUF2157 domain-containing protein [Candidatus Caccocola faecipullorum]